jgi:hypothetical protein
MCPRFLATVLRLRQGWDTAFGRQASGMPHSLSEKPLRLRSGVVTEQLDQQGDILVVGPSPDRGLSGEGGSVLPVQSSEAPLLAGVCRERAEAYFLANQVLCFLHLNAADVNANVVLVKRVVNVNEPNLPSIITTTSGGDHVELIVGQLDRGFDKLVSHLFLQDLPDDCEDCQGSSFLMQNFAFIDEVLQKIIG